MIQRSALRWWLITFVAAFSWTLAGCPSGTPVGGGGGDDMMDDDGDGMMDDGMGDDGMMDDGSIQNQSPSAVAGVNQEVDGGDTVQLDGSGSADLDGDTLSFSWTQIDGTLVTLMDADTATPSFIAPVVTDTLVFELTVDDGNGASDTDTVTVDVIGETGVLFVVNNNDGVTSYSSPEELNGDVAPTTELPAGTSTGIFQPRSIAITRDGVLLISSQNDAIVAYNDGFNATGETPVDRTIEGDNTLLNTPISFGYDDINDRLFVGNTNSENGILVFDNVSNSAFSGDVAPDRTFGPTDRFPFDPMVSITSTFDAMEVDADGRLYASDTSGTNVNQSRILVFDVPGSATGATAPARTFTSTSWGQVEDIVVADDDTLYVVDGEDSVYVFAGASTLNGTVEPTNVITVQVGQPQLEGIVVSVDGTGFVADRGNFSVYAFNEVATRTGTIQPDRTLDGNSTQLRSPRQMYLFEPMD